MYEQLETLLIAMDGSFLIKLRMQDIFDDSQLTEIKLTLTEVLKQNQQYGTIPIQLLPLLVDTFLYLSSILDVSKHSERISYAIDDLSAIIHEYCSTSNGNSLSN